MAKISQNTKYVKLDDGVSFALVRTNPKLTTNTKLMYNGKKMYMESYASSDLLNRSMYKNVSVKQSGTYNKDIAKFLTGSGSQAYSVYQNFSDTTISDSFDNQFETMYWCGAEYIDSSFYSEEIGFVAPLYLREKLPNYFLIFRLDTPSNYNLNINEETGKVLDSTFDFKTDILDKAVLIKTFDLRLGSVLGNYIYNYINQDGFEFDKSMYVNFSNCEVTYYGINKIDGVLEKKVESFENELLKRDNPILKDDKWFTEGFERNSLIFPYIINIEYLFDDDNFKDKNGGESYDFARYIGVYCNNIEFGEFSDLNELSEFGHTQDDIIYYFEDNKGNLHRYSTKNISESSESENEFELKIDGKDYDIFDEKLISGFEKERITGYAEPLDIYEGFTNRPQYTFEILKPLEPGDWIGIKYNGIVECYFADNKTTESGEEKDMLIGEYSNFRFSVNEKSSLNDIAETLVKCINNNKKSKFEARCSNNIVVIYAKKENDSGKILFEASLLYNKKIFLPISNTIAYVDGNISPVENISEDDFVKPVEGEKSSFGNYYEDDFSKLFDVDIDEATETYKNVFKIYAEEYVFFSTDRYLKTNNGDGRRILTNLMYIDAEGRVDSEYRIIIVDAKPEGKENDNGYDISVSSTNQVEILDKFKPNYGVLSWFPVKDFDFDMNYSTYGQYVAFADECEKLSKKVVYKQIYNTDDTYADSDTWSTQEYTSYEINKLAKSPFFDEYGNSLETEYNYYFEQIHPDLCLLSKTTPYILKWGYYDEQKDSCENPYRLNVNKIFGVSNLSANTYLSNCDENEYTHNMPYYMTFDTPDYLKDYQYIESNDIYIAHNDKNKIDQYIAREGENAFKTFYDCVDYWINQFKRTDEDIFSHFFSGKKYGNRFDRKYSRLLGGDKFHNPSTLFRGVKFEVVRQYNGVDKRSSEYNNYKFSFIYIPVMLDTMVFSSTVYFVKNDTFKFIIGIVFVNTMLGKYNHNIFNGNVDYFYKSYLYAACKDIIRPETDKKIEFKLYDGEDNCIVESSNNDIWKEHYDMGSENNVFYMWTDNDGDNDGDSDEKHIKHIIVTKHQSSQSQDISKDIIIGEFDNTGNIGNDIEKIIKPHTEYTLENIGENNESITLLWSDYYEEFDITVNRKNTFKYYDKIICKIYTPYIEFKDMRFIDVCGDIKWKYYNEDLKKGYIIDDISELYFTSESLQNVLINMGVENSIESIKIYDNESKIDISFVKDDVKVDIISGKIKITSNDTYIKSTNGHIENLKINIQIRDQFGLNFDSLGLRNYFSPLNQISAHSITKYINSDYNVKYYSTVEDNKYKIRVIEPDSIEIEDMFECVPVKVTQNNKFVIGSIDIKEKMDVDKIGIKIINRYSGFYNPIFNDILYFGDYNEMKFELPYSNTNINYNYIDEYGKFGVIKNMFYHKTNISNSNKILTSVRPVYPAIDEYALDYRDYNIFSSSWDEGYFISQDDLHTKSVCDGIGSMKDGLCMFGSKYLNLPDDVFIDTFDNGKMWDEKMEMDVSDNTDVEIMYKEINNRTVQYYLFLEKRLKRYLKEKLMDVFSKYINKNNSFGNKGTIEDDVDEYVEKNLLKLYKVDKVYLYTKEEMMKINNKVIENEYLKYVNLSNELKIENGFPVVGIVDNEVILKDNKFSMKKTNEFDRLITYNLKSGYKESFGFGVSFKRK